MTKYSHCFVLAGKLIIILSIFGKEEYIIYQYGIVLAWCSVAYYIIPGTGDVATEGMVCIPLRLPPTTTGCSALSAAQRQYLLNCKVSRYCLLAFHGSCRSNLSSSVHPGKALSRGRWQPMSRCYQKWGHFRDAGPALKQHWNNVTCLLVYRMC